jgi:serine/threonine-protein kinase HipA
MYVWAWLPGDTEPVVAGVLQSSGEDLHFAYADSYLNRSDAVSLSPTLPLSDRWFTEVEDMRMPSALRDAAPDAWGRRVILDKVTGVHGRDADVNTLHESVYLLESGSNRFGAIDFQERHDVYAPREETATLDELHHAAELLDAGESLSESLARALVRGTSIGGARPKALLRGSEGMEYIAKFSSSSDIFPVVGSEAASLYLARETGMDVSEARMTRSLGKDVLLVKRFDRGQGGTRKMTVSALTLLGLGEMTSRYGTYPEIVNAVMKNDGDESTAKEMFRRIAFNIAISNTDDHLRNHAAFWDGLSPMSRTGDTARQAIEYGTNGERNSSFSELIGVASVYGMSKTDASEVVDRVRSAIADNWNDAADFARLSASDRNALFGRQFLHPAASYGMSIPTRKHAASSTYSIRSHKLHRSG